MRNGFRAAVSGIGSSLPNSTKCGGLTEALRIGWMAYEHNVLIMPHGWNTAIGLAADLHLTAAMSVARYVEYLTPCIYLDEMITEPFKPDAEGYLTTPAWGSNAIVRR
jgi:L-alanine-DL-glutamate epimerase-like enolase superfamily enzyme